MSWTGDTRVRSLDGTTIAVHTLGSGPGLIIVGGALQAGEDYLGLARLLAESFTVHVPDRRGRGGSGPHGENYSLATEVQDLQAVRSATGARAVFGHSYGGLVVLEAMAQGLPFSSASVFEPGVSIGDSIPVAWIPAYRARLARGDTYGAFADFIRSSPQSPAFVRLLPRGYLRLALRAMPGFGDRIAPRLEGNALEHEQVAARNDQFHSYQSILGRILLMAGAKSPGFVIATMEALHGAISGSATTVIPGASHMAPLARRPVTVAAIIAAHASAAQPV